MPGNGHSDSNIHNFQGGDNERATGGKLKGETGWYWKTWEQAERTWKPAERDWRQVLQEWDQQGDIQQTYAGVWGEDDRNRCENKEYEGRWKGA